MNRSKQKLNRVILAQDRMLDTFEKKYTKRIFNALKEQIRQSANSYGAFNDQPLFDALKPMYEEIYMAFATFQYNNFTQLVRKDASFFLNTWGRIITNYIFQSLAGRVTRINDTTRRLIQEALATGQAMGLDFDKIAQYMVEKLGDDMLINRAKMITRTELANVANMAKDQAKDDWKNETGEPIYKLWIHRYAKEPRSWHLQMDNDKAIPENQAFEVYDPKDGTTELMQRPHSEGASAKNVVNCSCIVIYVSESYAQSLNSAN